jgi:hypothetical protein
MSIVNLITAEHAETTENYFLIADYAEHTDFQPWRRI